MMPTPNRLSLAIALAASLARCLDSPEASPLAGKLVVVTGGANGIGRALCERFHAEGARKVVVVDLEESEARAVAETIDGDAYGVDVRDEPAISAMVDKVQGEHGTIDLFCSNAGIIALDGEPWWATSAPNTLRVEPSYGITEEVANENRAELERRRGPAEAAAAS